MEVKNAVITHAFIAVDNDRVLNAGLFLSDGVNRCKFEYKIRATSLGQFISRVLEMADVGAWHNLEGKAVRMVQDGTHIKAIGHIIYDNWFDPYEELAEVKKDSAA